MKKGKINLLSFEEDDNDEEELKIQMKPSLKKEEEQEILRTPLDFSQIKDRVIQMELDEEMVIEGEVADSLFNLEEEDNNLYELVLSKTIKEAKEKRRRREANNKISNQVEFMEELPEYVSISSITTKGDYWLTQDTKESEESFNRNSSRLVREDLFNEIEVDDASGAYTSFIGKSFEGRQGLMMTKKMLERDIKTENYDLELEVKEEEEEPELVVDEMNWEQSQVLKGIERGWNRLDDEMNFYSRQAKLPIFIPPLPLEKQGNFHGNGNGNGNFVETKEIELNIERISKDSMRLEERIKELGLEIENRRKLIEKSNQIETFLMRYSRFLSEKLPELNEISKDRVKWEHFFDDVDLEDSDLLDLPDIIKKITNLGLGTMQNYKESTELFIKYHFMAMEFDSSDPKIIWESSGLADALGTIENPMELLAEIFADDLDKLKLLETAIFQ